MASTGLPVRNWSLDELRVLAAIYFNASFSIGDDTRDECRAIADCFGRTPASIDRQWRNLDAVIKGKTTYNIGGLVRQCAADYLNNPAGNRTLALAICEQNDWPLNSLIKDGTQAALRTPSSDPAREEVMAALRDLCDNLEYKMFASGSQGFFAQKKLRLSGGARYQGQVTAVLIGSKDDLTVDMKTSRTEIGYAVAPIIATLEAKAFKTGRTGYYTNGKAQVASERFQIGIQAVQIGEA